MQDTAPPLPDLVSLKPFAQLISSAPSPNLYFNLVDLIFAYVYTLRLFNGDIEYDLPSCFSSLFTVSLVLSSPATAHASVEAALEACSSAALGHPSTQSSPSFCASAIRDTAQVMYFTPLILRALAHMRGILQRLQQEQRAADKKPSKSQTKVNSPDDSQKTDSKRNSFRALALARKQKQKKHATNSRGLGGGDKLALMRAGGVRGVAREGTRSDKPRKRRKGRSKLQSLAELEHKLYFYTCWIHSYHTVSILENKEETNAVTKLQGAVKLVELGDAISLAWRKRTKGIHIAQSTKRQHTVVDRLKI